MFYGHWKEDIHENITAFMAEANVTMPLVWRHEHNGVVWCYGADPIFTQEHVNVLLERHGELVVFEKPTVDPVEE